MRKGKESGRQAREAVGKWRRGKASGQAGGQAGRREIWKGAAVGGLHVQ